MTVTPEEQEAIVLEAVTAVRDAVTKLLDAGAHELSIANLWLALDDASKPLADRLDRLIGV